jgi:hypothetical protein
MIALQQGHTGGKVEHERIAIPIVAKDVFVLRKNKMKMNVKSKYRLFKNFKWLGRHLPFSTKYFRLRQARGLNTADIGGIDKNQ